MTLTAKTMEWLNQNRHRAYPMRREEWRIKVPSGSMLDCVLLDAIICNVNAVGYETVEISSIDITSERTEVIMKYGDRSFTISLVGGETSGALSYEHTRLEIGDNSDIRKVEISLSFSSHAYIVDTVGYGHWDLGCPLLISRVVNLTDGFGVDGIATNGSLRIDGHESAAIATDDVWLEDGFRTSPVIMDGKVLVRVGTRFGKNPCKYDYGDDAMTDCRKPMFFFCGQNAINNGNIVLKGGKGVNVIPGGKYTINDKNSKCNGKTIPCIEIVAGKELLDIYSPSEE